MLIDFRHPPEGEQDNSFDIPGKIQSSDGMSHFMNEDDEKKEQEVEKLGLADGDDNDDPEKGMDVNVTNESPFIQMKSPEPDL